MSQPPYDPGQGRYPRQQPDSRYQRLAQRPAQPSAFPPDYMPPPRPPAPSRRLPRIRLPLGLILTIAGAVVQLLSLTVLPWTKLAGKPTSVSALDLLSGDVKIPANGFGEWYVLVFTYPAVALSIVLALAAVFESVAMKVIWGILAIVGLGWLAVKYSLLPFLDADLEFTTREMIIGVVAAAAAVVLLFVLKMAVSMFRRMAVLVLLALTAVHIGAVVDLSDQAGLSGLSIGAFGPVLGYLLCIAAALAPRRLPRL